MTPEQATLTRRASVLSSEADAMTATLTTVRERRDAAIRAALDAGVTRSELQRAARIPGSRIDEIVRNRRRAA